MKPTETPWGKTTEATELAEGVWRFRADDGYGYLISEERRQSLPPELKHFDTVGGGNWFDMTDAVVLTLGLPDLFNEKCCWRAVQIARTLDYYVDRGAYLDQFLAGGSGGPPEVLAKATGWEEQYRGRFTPMKIEVLSNGKALVHLESIGLTERQVFRVLYPAVPNMMPEVTTMEAAAQFGREVLTSSELAKLYAGIKVVLTLAT